MRMWFIAAGLLALAADQKSGEVAPTETTDPAVLEVCLEDGGRLLARLADATVELETRYGTLQIPASDIRRIQLATRLTSAEQAQQARAMANLNSQDPAAVRAAVATLVAQGELALPELCRRARAADNLTLTSRLREVIEQIFSQAGERPPTIRDSDQIDAAGNQIRGRLLASSLKIVTPQFGALDLKLADVRSLRSLAYSEPTADEYPLDDSDALPDPGSPSHLANNIGLKRVFRVTGNGGGSVWGTDIYTSDSTLATVAVHAGVLGEGETGLVLVEMVDPLDSYAGSSRHGITTSSFGSYQGAYRVRKPPHKVRFRLFSWK